MNILVLDCTIGSTVPYSLYKNLGEAERAMRVPDNFKDCVVFVGYRKNSDKSKYPIIGGTAFIYNQPYDKVKEDSHVYIITTKHSIENIDNPQNDGKVYLRFNTEIRENGRNERTYQWISTEVKNWTHHLETDISIYSWGDIDTGQYEDVFVATVGPDMAADKSVVKSEFIGIGDEVITVGLFIRRAGEKRNVPIVRIGNIAAIPDENETVNTKSVKNIEAYLVELRSIGGLSGSPVFVHLGGSKLPALMSGKSTSRISERSPVFIKDTIYLIGMMAAHWNIAEDEMAVDFYSNNKEALNTGIGVVIPFWKIQELLDDPKLVEERENEEEKIINENAATPDFDSEDLTK